MVREKFCTSIHHLSIHLSIGSEGQLVGSEGLLERPEGLPGGPEGLPQRPEGLPEGPEGLSAEPEGLPDRAFHTRTESFEVLKLEIAAKVDP